MIVVVVFQVQAGDPVVIALGAGDGQGGVGLGSAISTVGPPVSEAKGGQLRRAVALTVQIRIDEGRRWRWFRLMGRPGRGAGCSENGQMLVGTFGKAGAQLAHTGETALCRHGLAHRSSVASQQVLADETSSFVHTLEVWMRGRDAMEAWVSTRSEVEC